MLKRKLISVIILCLLLPMIVISSYFLAKGKQYYLVSVIVILLSMLPFFASLERKKLQTRELVITASVVAIAVASRAAFFFLPQVKPMCAVLIVTAMTFGAEFGFISGAMSMLISNFIYGQGMWTPFQMLGMGMTVFLTVLITKKVKTENRIVAGIVSALLCLVIYGGIVDLSSVFMMTSEKNMQSILAVYASGLPFNMIHAVTTGIIVTLIQPEISEKLERIKIKYGLFGEKE